MIQFPSETIWDGAFPSFWVWLYGRRMKRRVSHWVTPMDALRQFDQTISHMPPPVGLVDRILAAIALRKLRAMRAGWERLIKMNIVVMGLVAPATSTVPKEEQL